MATYNGGRYLEEQLDSIFRQTRTPDEIVIGDDGSTDHTIDIIESFARRATIEVRLLSNPRRMGTTRNFVNTLQQCRGDIVLFSDQDDVWSPERVEVTGRAFAEHPACDLVFSDGRLIDGDGAPVPGRLWERAGFAARDVERFAAGHAFDVLLRNNVVTGASMAVKRASALAACPIPDGWVHDAWWAMTLGLDRPVVAIEQPLIDYRVHGAQQVGVRELSISGVMSMLQKHDAAYYVAEAANMRSLDAHLDRAHPARPRIRQKERLLERRAEFRLHPVLAAPGLLRSLARGDYRSFGMGHRQFLYDLTAPAAGAVLRSRWTNRDRARLRPRTTVVDASAAEPRHT